VTFVAYAASTELWQAVLRSTAERPLTEPVLVHVGVTATD
jgi:hypothetical protein